MSDAVAMGRPKTYPFPENMTYDRDAGRYVVRNPTTGKRQKFADEATARRVVEKLNQLLAVEKQLDALKSGRPTIAGLVEGWLENKLQFMPWDGGTRYNMVAKMNRIKEELGKRTIAHTDCMYLEDWLKCFCNTADTFNKWRYALSLLWKYAISRKLCESNEPLKIEERSTSKKLESNQKLRQGLDIQGFWKIHEKAPGYMQIAMEESLVTLQARSEVCNIKHTDHRDGFLFIIRDKTSAESDMAFIKIALTEQILDIQARARQLYSIASPYVVHRAPDRLRRQWIDGKPHWTYVNPEYLTKEFAKVRDATGFFDHLKPEQRPSFHEIRGLGSRVYREQGMPQKAITALMTHSDPRTTEIYLQGGAKALHDDDYIPVVAPLKLKDLRS